MYTLGVVAVWYLVRFRFFFFKQKTAYEMRISDWSSDVCSSDLLIYGDDPQQGVIEGSRFIHPELRLTFTAPQGFYMVNSTRAVSINGQSGKAQMTMAAYNGNLADYVRPQFATLGGTEQDLRPTNVPRTTVTGIPQAYGTAPVTTGSSQVDAGEFGRAGWRER